MALTNTTTLNDLLPAITAEALFVASEKIFNERSSKELHNTCGTR